MEKSKSNSEKSKNTALELSEEILNASQDAPMVYDVSLIPMSIRDKKPDFVNHKIVNQKYYNNFNFSKLAKANESLNVALGVTSANKGEGKTLVASNMAVSLAQAYRQRTVLVDLNFKDPQLHKIFGISLEPGLTEALEKRVLNVNPTSVSDLFLLSAGNYKNYKPAIKDTIALREILYTLKHEFDFVIADMSSVFPFEEFPIHFINEMDGLIAVVDTQKTRKEHLRKIFKHVDEKRFVGYILNKLQGL